MTDVVVTVPARGWDAWLAEGDLPGDPPTGREYFFTVPTPPKITPGERVYIVAHGRLRGYAPLIRVESRSRRSFLVRAGGAIPLTIREAIRGFRGYRYRWWDRSEEILFPEWRSP